MNPELNKDTSEFFFDDEPLEHILYDDSLKGRTVANLYLQVRESVIQIESAYNGDNIQDAIAMASELGRSGTPISQEMYLRLIRVMRTMVPDYPNPVMIFDLLPLKPLLEQIWMMALDKENKALQLKVGPLLYKWYELHGKYRDAREVLDRLIGINRELKNHFDEAVYLNNFAFEYTLERRFREAMPLFEKAASMFEQLNNKFQYANSLANYWICRFDLGDIDDLERIDSELKTLSGILNQSGHWQERKPLILLAQIEERRGNIQNAIQLVERAIESCSQSKTRYPEQDAIYLEYLKRKQADYQ